MAEKKATRIAIISGKGGTGKTFFSSAFASLLRGKAVFADCDVDAANMALALGGGERVLHRESFSGGMLAQIDAERCTGCGQCAQQCRFDAIRMEEKAVVDPISCEGCGVCGYICPAEAVRFEKNISGDWMISESSYGTLVHAELAAGGENSGKLVHQVREAADREADRLGTELVLIDGPPGTGCPVLAAVSDTEGVVLVSEPTPSGLHDLERAAKTAADFSIPVGVIMNKSDLNPDICRKAQQLCDNSGYTWLGSFPYDRRAAESSARLEDPFRILDEAAREKIVELAEGVLNMVGVNMLLSPSPK